MWPWEHLALGYVCYAAARRVRGGPPPSHAAAVALAAGTQAPDLVDKPLAWGLGVLPSGVSLAHSIFVAIPVAAAAVVVADRRDARAVGAAFGVGYLSHLLGDGLYPLLVAGEASVDYMLWPLVERPVEEGPFLATVGRLWTTFREFLATPRGRGYLALELSFLAFAAGLWLWDGTPGLGRPGRVKE